MIDKSVFGITFILLSASGAGAAQLTSQFNVTLTITATCSLSTPADLAFGSTQAVSANIDATTTIQVTCSNTAPYTIGLGQGLYGTAINARKMKLSTTTDTANYALYRDASRTQNWGETIGTDTASGTGTGSAQTHTVYGRVPTQAGLPIGAYSDTVVVTLTY